MANKALQKEKKMKNPRKPNLIKEGSFEIDKNAFKGPFQCHGKLTIQIKKNAAMKGINFDYEAWQCSKCGKDYLDSKQAEKLERIWTIEKLLDEKLISVERAVNYDGRTFFVRFPAELTRKWRKGANASITLINPEEFLIKIKM